MDNLKISSRISLKPEEIDFHAIRAQGAGGQNVNKVSSAIHLQFDLQKSSLPESLKTKVMAMSDQRISRGGIITIKAQRFRSQDKNREDAIDRLLLLLKKAAITSKVRKTTKPSRNAKKKRMDSKTRRGKVKSLRGKVTAI
jgi:ribosome-associated protein